MTPQTASQSPLTVEEYLTGELRHEYIGGEVYIMTGASDRHGLIVNTLAFALTPAVRKRDCPLFSNDMKVHLHHAEEEAFYYPDLLLACDPDDHDDYFVTRPCLIPKGDPPALLGRLSKFDESGSPMAVAKREPPSITQRRSHEASSKLSIPPKYAVSQVIGFLKGKSTIHIARVYST